MVLLRYFTKYILDNFFKQCRKTNVQTRNKIVKYAQTREKIVKLFCKHKLVLK